jgi:single-strand DNA-binding protein
MSGTGRLTEDPSLRYSASGTAVLTVNLAFNARRFDKDQQQWVDGDVFFVRATAFKQLAESAAESLSRGDEVVVTGRLKTEQWDDRSGGVKRSATALLLDSIGPNLALATAKVSRVSRSGGSGGTADTAPTDDPWGQTPAANDEAPF